MDLFLGPAIGSQGDNNNTFTWSGPSVHREPIELQIITECTETEENGTNGEFILLGRSTRPLFVHTTESAVFQEKRC
jgi:hypothetical protein